VRISSVIWPARNFVGYAHPIGVDHALHDANADVQFTGDCLDPVTPSTQSANRGLDMVTNLRPTQALSLCSGSPQSGVDTLHDHVSLELSKDAAHVEHGLSGRCRCVESLLMKIQSHSELSHLRHEAYELMKRASKAVYRPCHDHIKAAASGVTL
jgi:hypothetical protein